MCSGACAPQGKIPYDTTKASLSQIKVNLKRNKSRTDTRLSVLLFQKKRKKDNITYFLNTYYVSSSILCTVIVTKIKASPWPLRTYSHSRLRIFAQNYKIKGGLLKDLGFGLDQRSNKLQSMGQTQPAICFRTAHSEMVSTL